MCPQPRALASGFPLAEQGFGFCFGSGHYQIPALARFLTAVGVEGKTDAFGPAARAGETQMAPPGSVVVPDVVIRPVMAVGRGNEFVFHNELGKY